MAPNVFKSLFFSFSLLFISCRKDIDAKFCIQIVKGEQQVTIGNLTGVILSTINDTISGSEYDWDSLKLDIDHDRIFDILLVSGISGLPGPGGFAHVWMLPLHDEINFHCNSNGDTVYYHFDSTLISSGPDVYYYAQIHSCHVSGDPIIIEKVEDDLLLHHYGDELLINDYWSVSEFNLYGANYGIEDWSTPEHDVKVYNFSCDNPEPSIPFYLGFRKKVCGYWKLGWLKLTIDGSHCILHETAIQE